MNLGLKLILFGSVQLTRFDDPSYFWIKVHTKYISTVMSNFMTKSTILKLVEA